MNASHDRWLRIAGWMAGGLWLFVVLSAASAMAQPTTGAPSEIRPAASTVAEPPTSPPQSPELTAALADIERAEQLLEEARASAEAADEPAGAAPINDWLDQAGAQAAGAVVVIEPELALIAARIEQLGPPPTEMIETPDIQARRRALETARGELDSALKRANLIQVEAGQIQAALAAKAAEAVAERMNQRIQSPLSPGLWLAAARDLPMLEGRFAAVGAGLAPANSANLGLLLASLAFAVLLAGPAAIVLRMLGRAFALKRAEADGRLRRSAFAFWMLLVGFVTSALAALAVLIGLQVSGIVSQGISNLISSAIVALFIGAFVVALTEALLLVGRPEWRMVRIDTAEAKQLRPFGWIAALAIIAATTSDAFILFIQPPASIATALQALIALFCVGLIIGLLIVVGRIRARDDGIGGNNVFYGRLPTLALILLWPASLFILYRGALGYVVWATETAMWLVWGGVVLLTFYLLARLVDDACRVFFTAKNRLARSAHARFGVKDNTLLQFGVLLSAALRLGLLLIAVMGLLVPFGTGFTSFFDLFAVLGHGVKVGEVEISPAAVARAVIVLLVVLAIFNALRRWLVESYLPTTSLDAGAVNSIGVVTGYLGAAAAVLWALAAFGVQVQQLAFLVSALSVGIGFGLQAITQNFVSGLILLAERPVRIGDRIKVGDQVGRIGRISVRATQILADDGSRLVVPNSELITKTVETVAASEPDPTNAPVVIRGEIAVDFDVDPDQVQALLTKAARSHAAIRQTPSPTAYVAAVRDDRIDFVWTAAVDAGEDAERVRGEIWLTILRDLRTTDAKTLRSPARPRKPKTAPSASEPS